MQKRVYGRPFKKGHPKVGGRPKGGINKLTGYMATRMAMGFNPFGILGQLATGMLICQACRGAGKTKYQPQRGNGKIFERTCESCYGSGYERIPPAVVAKAAAELAEYEDSKKRSIEHSGEVTIALSLADRMMERRRQRHAELAAAGNGAITDATETS